jgi:photosystem I subunit III
VARAQKAEVAKQAGTALAAAALASVVSLSAVDAAYADVAGLTPCSESKGFAKTQKNQIKKLEKRMKLVCLADTVGIFALP